jgi:hypothetical protein
MVRFLGGRINGTLTLRALYYFPKIYRAYTQHFFYPPFSLSFFLSTKLLNGNEL